MSNIDTSRAQTVPVPCFPPAAFAFSLRKRDRFSCGVRLSRSDGGITPTARTVEAGRRRLKDTPVDSDLQDLSERVESCIRSDVDGMPRDGVFGVAQCGYLMSGVGVGNERDGVRWVDRLGTSIDHTRSDRLFSLGSPLWRMVG